jgi:large subunit ribosomal protein L15
VRPGFEGGQLPLVQRLPYKRGFKNINRVEYAAINVGDLNARFAANAVVNPGSLVRAGLLRSVEEPYKILANGELDRPLIVTAAKVTESARAKIEAAGGRLQTPVDEAANGS